MTALKIARTIPSVRGIGTDLRQTRVPSKTLGLVPTMGALHEGHLALIRASKQQCDLTAVSIFVNPTQFGPAEDLALYPRPFDADCRLLEAEGVDLLFAPDAIEMYPASGLRTFVEVAQVGDRLDGRSRPGHFRGVATVVAKLFHILAPDIAFFGQKDAAQVAVLCAMVRDLNFAVEITVCPTVREDDGLALSSRNRFLNPSERIEARALSQSLRQVSAAVKASVSDTHLLRATLYQHLSRSPGVRIDYAEIVNPETLLPVADLANGALVAVAAWIGNTRLIDNIVLPAASTASKETQ